MPTVAPHGPPERTRGLTHNSHQLPAAAAYLRTLTASCSLADPRRILQYASGRLGRIPCHRTNLRRLASTPGEKCGLTILEITISIVIITVVALSTTLVLVPIARQSRVSREVEIANAEATDVLEKIHSSPFDEIQNLYPPDSTVVTKALQSGVIVVHYPDPTADPLTIQLPLSWSSASLGGDLQRTFTTVRTR